MVLMLISHENCIQQHSKEEIMHKQRICAVSEFLMAWYIWLLSIFIMVNGIFVFTH